MADSLFLEFFCFDFLAVIKISLVFLVLMVPTSLYFDQSKYIGQLHSLGKFILSSSYQIVSNVHMNVAFGLIGHCGLLNMLIYHFIYLWDIIYIHVFLMYVRLIMSIVKK